jgi:hypothetical protein
MPHVKAWQHIYGRVEAELSPRKRGGFQTLFYTRPELAPDDVEQIERRLAYHATDASPPKRLFFATDQGKLVVGQAVAVDDRDGAGRKGGYVAHSLVFAPDDLANIASDILWLFHEFPFISTLQQALSCGDPETGDVRPIGIEFPDDTTVRQAERAARWPVEQIQRLARLALTAERLAADRAIISMVGTADEVLEALAAALLAVPNARITPCCFDTHFVRCNPATTRYWAVGFPDTPAGSRYITVDAHQREVSTDTPQEPETAFERWAHRAIGTGRLEPVTKGREAAESLCEWLEGNAPGVPPLRSGDQEIISTVFHDHPQLVHRTLVAQLAAQITDPLAQRVAPSIFQEYFGEKPVELFQIMAGRAPMGKLLDRLLRSYQQEGFRRPGEVELAAIAAILDREDHPRLGLFHACWTNQVDSLRRRLAMLRDDDYPVFVKAAICHDLAEPAELFLPDRADAMLAAYSQCPPDRQTGLASLAQELLRIGQPHHLSRLVPSVAQQPPQELMWLRKLLQAGADVPADFREAIEAFRVETSAAPRKKKGFFSGLFGRRK